MQSKDAAIAADDNYFGVDSSRDEDHHSSDEDEEDIGDGDVDDDDDIDNDCSNCKGDVDQYND